MNTHEEKTVFMKLDDEPYELIKNGKKTIEVRCNDEKRSELRQGDRIVFSKHLSPDETLSAHITGLFAFRSFYELYSAFPAEMFGYDKSVSAERLSEMINNIYPKEKQEKYGALAIMIQLYSNN